MILLDANIGGINPQLIMIGMIFIVMYFFMIRPQIKKQKKEIAFRAALKKGDIVVTIGGIHGKIIDIKKDTIILEVNDKNKLKIDKNAISVNSQLEEIKK